MDAFEKLKAEATAKRDRAIARAKREYSETLATLRDVKYKLRRKPTKRNLAPQLVSNDFSGVSMVVAAEAILRERGPLTLLEIVAEAQARGCKREGDPRQLRELLRSGLKYHSTRFVRLEDGKWRLST